MPELGGFDFAIQVSEAFTNRLLQALFAAGDTKTRFAYDEPGQSGLLRSRDTVEGRIVYQRFLLDMEFAYEVELSNPAARFLATPTEHIELGLSFGLRLPRNVVARLYDAQAGQRLPADPNAVNVSLDYQEEWRTGPDDDPYPGEATPPLRGRITLKLPLVHRGVGRSHTALAATGAADRGAVATIELTIDGVDPALVRFLSVLVSQAVTTLLRKEIDGYDLAPLVGNLEVFGLAARLPVGLRIGTGPALALAFNESATVEDGDPAALPFVSGAPDLAVQFREAFLVATILALYQNYVLPHRFAFSGKPDPAGPILLIEPRLAFLGGRMKVTLRFDVQNGAANVTLDAEVGFVSAGGQLKVTSSNPHITVGVSELSLLGLIDAVTFHLLFGLVGGVLSSILGPVINNSLEAGLDAFLASGDLAFGFAAPVRNSRMTVKFGATAFEINPGIAVLRGALQIQSATS